MRLGKLLGLVFALSILAASSAGALELTASVRTPIRSGPGNYFEILSFAEKGSALSVVGEIDGWYKVQLADERRGYVSVRSQGPRKLPAGLKIDRLDQEKGVGTAASSEIMAATRGVADLGVFARKYAQSKQLDPAALERYHGAAFSPAEYRRFIAELPACDKRPAEGLAGEAIPESDRELGAAIAVRLLAMGPSADQRLWKYVSLVGTAALENTPLYDEPFVFIVIESPLINSFCTPGGYIFVTTGALSVMKSEAELAGVLAHEISHVLRRHGVHELGRQASRVKTERAIDDLDGELDKLGLDKGDAKLQQELGDMADEIYETLISGRKRADEDESDRLGTQILHNSCYKASGLRDFLLSTDKAATGDSRKTQAYRAAAERAAALDELIRSLKLLDAGRADLPERFKASTGR